MQVLENRRVLVTGAGRNIGLAIARRCLEAGARVMLMDVLEEHLTQARAGLGALAEQALTFVADVRDRERVAAGVAAMAAAWGGVDAAVTSAGIYPDRLLLEMSEDEWDAVMDINAKGTFLVSQAVARQLVAQGTGGQIIHISSGSARTGRVGAGHYCASKAAVGMLTQVLAMELGPHGIQVNAIAPGLVTNEHSSPEFVESYKRIIPMGRVGEPQDIAEAVLMLLGSECTYLTGQTIFVDGGLIAGRYTAPVR